MFPFPALNRTMATAPADPADFQPIDGGWGWVVVFGAHISIGFAYSLPKVLSIFYKEIQDDLGTSFSEIALISSVMLAAVYGGGRSHVSVAKSSSCGGRGGDGCQWGVVLVAPAGGRGEHKAFTVMS